MPDLKISQLAAAAQPWGAADVIPLENQSRAAGTSGQNFSLTARQIAALSRQSLSALDAQFGIKGDGVTDDTTAISAFLVAVANTTHRRGYFPAATYKVTGTTGNIFTFAADGLDIFGDGMGQTVFKHIPGGTTLTNISIFGTAGAATADTVIPAGNRKIHLHDFTIQGDATNTSVSNYSGIGLVGGLECEIDHIEFFGFGGAGVNESAYNDNQPWNQAEFSTTLGTAISSGLQTVTPTSPFTGQTAMDGIQVGRRLWVQNSGGGTYEQVFVKSRTATTFTATFANSHLATDTVILRTQGQGRHHVHHCIVHDCYLTQAFLVGSNANRYEHNIIRCQGSIGTTVHGFYTEGGYNTFEQNTVIGASAASFQLRGSFLSNSRDCSGNRVINNYSEDAGNYHVVADDTTSDGTNVDMPSGTSTNRYFLVENNVFRNTSGAVAAGISGYGVFHQALSGDIIGNVFEDVAMAQGAYIQVSSASGAQDAKIIGNQFNQINLGVTPVSGTIFPANYIIDCHTNGSATIEANDFNLQGVINAVIYGSSTTIIRGNTFRGKICGKNANITPNATLIWGGLMIKDNIISTTDTGSNGHPYLFQNNTQSGATTLVSGAEISGNNFTFSYTGGPLVTFLGTETLAFHDNTINSQNWVDVTTTGLGLKIYANDGNIQYAGQGATSHGVFLDRSAGRLLPFSKSTNTLTHGLLVAYSSGAVATIGTSANSTWDGVSPSDTDGVTNGIYIAGGVGQIIPVTSDGAWTAGHTAVNSTTTGGQIHDTGGTTIPGSGSWGIFVDTGGGAGTAHVLVMKTR